MNSLGVRVILPSVVALQPFCSGMSGCRYNMLFHSVVINADLFTHFPLTGANSVEFTNGTNQVFIVSQNFKFLSDDSRPFSIYISKVGGFFISKEKEYKYDYWTLCFVCSGGWDTWHLFVDASPWFFGHLSATCETTGNVVWLAVYD